MSSKPGNKIGSDIKGAAKGGHDAEDAIRGTLPQTVNATFTDKAGDVKNSKTAGKALTDMAQDHQRVGAMPGLKTGGPGGAATTNSGAHSGAVGSMHSAPPSTKDMQIEPLDKLDRY